MKEIQSTKDIVVLVDDEDFEFLNNFKWHDVHGYACGCVNGKQILMHRLIMDAPRELFVDHINGIPSDNQRKNLRFSTNSQNQANRKNQKDNTSGYKGVTFQKANGKWLSQIKVNQINIHIGYFNTPEEAAKAYDEYASLHFGEYASLNFPLTNS